ncbi:MAG: LytTR family DNA-binding domain-containing protein [Saonia sp.]
MDTRSNFYIFNSRIATHVLFWLGYYILFGLIWVTDKGYFNSFYLEFVLLPIRILVVYVTIYFLLPTFLLKRDYFKFFLGYFLLLALGGLMQRFFIHLFYERILLNTTTHAFFDIMSMIRAVVLINTTALLVLGAKLFQLWQIEHEKNRKSGGGVLEIKSNRRIHLVPMEDILYIEGLGNYVTYYLNGNSKVTAYSSVKKALAALPENFVRVHKSYVVNKHHIKSYDTHNIEIQDQMVPRGKSVSEDLFFVKV